MRIIEIQDSNRKNKRFIAILLDDDGDQVRIHFGLAGGSTYIDHKDPVKRAAYWARHSGNIQEAYYIDHLIPSPALLSAALLWGPYQTLIENVEFLNELWEKS